MDRLYVVVPCYKEEAVLPETSRRLKEKMSALIRENRIAPSSRVLFVDDGSSDRTWEIIEQLHAQDAVFSGLKLSRNRGHQNALLAGLAQAAGQADVIVSMDADLQDDIGAMDKMLEKYASGCEVVYGVRSARKTDTFFKRFTAEGFYKIMNLMGAEVVFNHADYRLLSKKALEGLFQFGEVNLFLRGLVPLVGYKSATVEYERASRLAGESKYPLKKMLALAGNGITSLSTKPLHMITGLGFFVCFASVIGILWALVAKLLGNTVAGWASLTCAIFFMGGIQLLCLGVIGEYIAKIYSETKARPRFIVAETTFEEPKED